MPTSWARRASPAGGWRFQPPQAMKNERAEAGYGLPSLERRLALLNERGHRLLVVLRLEAAHEIARFDVEGRARVVLQRRGEVFLHVAEGERGPRRQFARHGHGLLAQPGVRHHLGGEAEGERLLGAYLAREEH